MIRWKYLLPRLGILSFLVLIIHLVSVPATRYLVVQSTQSVTGAKVDLGEIEVSWWKGWIKIRDLQVADPQQPMKNLLQSGVAEFQLDPMQLLQRRWVVKRAKLERVQFGTPRTDSGALESRPRKSRSEAENFVVDFVRERVRSLGRNWASQLEAGLPEWIESQLETVRLANEMRERWPRTFQQHRDNATALQQRVRALQADFSKRTDNPLRDLQRLQENVIEAQQLVRDFQLAQQGIQALSDQYRADQQSLQAASQRDREKILRIHQAVQIDPQQLTQLLLSEQQAELIRETVAWLQWFRSTVPDPEDDFQPNRARGFDVRFREQPTLVFEQLDLDGEGEVGGQPLAFAGQVSNLSTSPELMPVPVTFELRGKSKVSVAISGSVDRRGPQKIDQLTISCPWMATPSRTLGEPDSLLLQLTPGNSSLELQTTITDNQLTGHIRVRQSGVDLSAEKIHDVANADVLLQLLNDQLQTLDSFEMNVKLGGTLDQPTATLESDLGDRVAVMMASVFENSLRQVARSKAERLEMILGQQITQVDQLFAGSSREILAMLKEDVTLVADLQELIQPRNPAFPKFR